MSEGIRRASSLRNFQRGAGISGGKQAAEIFDYFVAVPSEEVPNNSLLREFIGGSCFNTDDADVLVRS